MEPTPVPLHLFLETTEIIEKVWRWAPLEAAWHWALLFGVYLLVYFAWQMRRELRKR